MAWYPIYRIPDAPLAAKFLTYHSLLPKPSSQTHFGVTGMGRTVASAPNSVEHSPLCFPILGLKCAEQRGEPWLEMYDQAPGPRMEWEVGFLHHCHGSKVATLLTWSLIHEA